jgi:hypothetical protein
MIFIFENGKVDLIPEAKSLPEIKNLKAIDKTKGKVYFYMWITYLYYVYRQNGLYENLFTLSRKRQVCVDQLKKTGEFYKDIENVFSKRLKNSRLLLVFLFGLLHGLGFASVLVETTGKYDIDLTLAEVKNAVDGISSFPVDAEKPIVFKRRSSTQAAMLGLSGDVDLITLKKLADVIEIDIYNLL